MSRQHLDIVDVSEPLDDGTYDVRWSNGQRTNVTAEQLARLERRAEQLRQSRWPDDAA